MCLSSIHFENVRFPQCLFRFFIFFFVHVQTQKHIYDDDIVDKSNFQFCCPFSESDSFKTWITWLLFVQKVSSLPDSVLSRIKWLKPWTNATNYYSTQTIYLNRNRLLISPFGRQFETILIDRNEIKYIQWRHLRFAQPQFSNSHSNQFSKWFT